ncbi:MAG: CHAT domain-containing protein [Pseudomonadota bacterium]
MQPLFRLFLLVALASLAQVASGAVPQEKAQTAALASERGDAARAQGDLAAALEHYQEAVEHLSVSGVPQAGAADPLRNLGTVSAMGGDLETAEDYYQQSLAVAEAAGNETAAARVLNNLGILSVRRGDVAGAETFYQRALAINERIGAWRSRNINLYNLADVADARGDLATAITLMRRSLAGFEQLGTDSLRIAQTQSSLADMLVEAGQLGEAQVLFDAALSTYRREAPDSPDVTLLLRGLGSAAQRLGDVASAERYFLEVLSRHRAVSTSSVETAQAHQGVAELYLETADYDAAERHLDDARKIYARVAPDSVELSTALHGLARVHAARAQYDEALDYHERSIDALEAQTRTLGGADDSRSRFGDRYATHYKEYIALLQERGLSAKAFEVLERYRARSIVTLLAEQALSLDNEVPAALLAERAQLQEDYDKAQNELIELARDGAPEPDLAALRSTMTELRVKRDGVAQRIRSSDARSASLIYPQPADLNAAARSLEEGTLALSYSVHSDYTLLFALTRDALRTVRIPVGADALREQVRRFRFLIETGRDARAPSPSSLAALGAAGAALYELLLRPVEVFADAERFLIVPDGPLHTLPWAALVVPGRDDRPRYLVEQVPLHKAQSLTLYSRLRRPAVAEALPARVAVFGNLYQDRPARSSDATRFAHELSNLQPLPFVKQEIDGINAVFAASSRVYAGSDATERNVLEAAPHATYLHFATHSVINEQAPLDSALVLNGGAKSGNGLLQAWEIIEKLRTDASMVVLSACDTARGMETAGDGLVGLTRAFHHAGARSVVASQWQVSDQSTATLMTSLYRHLGAGRSRDAALREAQRALIGDAVFSHPYYWAAFELSGWYR